MKLTTERLRCDNCGIEALRYATEVEGYGAPVTYALESWHTIQHRGKIRHFCSWDCVIVKYNKEYVGE